jgi:hypothetical protein
MRACYVSLALALDYAVLCTTLQVGPATQQQYLLQERMWNTIRL